MNQMKDLNDFKIPDMPEKHIKEAARPQGAAERLHQKCISFCQKRLGENSKVTKFIAQLKTSRTAASGDEVIDALSRVKQLRSAKDRFHATLTIVLIITMVLVWQLGLPMLVEADQLNNDIAEQKQIIEIEEKEQ